MPIVGAGAGTYSFLDLRDAAAATIEVLGGEARGIFNIVDDSPARLSKWLPSAAELLGAPAPRHMDEAVARKKLGDIRVYYMIEQRGASNVKAKRDLDRQPAFPSWQAGFEALCSNRSGESFNAA
jgi:nucleoside-diphosphate-sugar epimerase